MSVEKVLKVQVQKIFVKVSGAGQKLAEYNNVGRQVHPGNEEEQVLRLARSNEKNHLKLMI